MDLTSSITRGICSNPLVVDLTKISRRCIRLGAGGGSCNSVRGSCPVWFFGTSRRSDKMTTFHSLFKFPPRDWLFGRKALKCSNANARFSKRNMIFTRFDGVRAKHSHNTTVEFTFKSCSLSSAREGSPRIPLEEKLHFDHSDLDPKAGTLMKPITPCPSPEYSSSRHHDDERAAGCFEEDAAQPFSVWPLLRFGKKETREKYIYNSTMVRLRSVYAHIIGHFSNLTYRAQTACRPPPLPRRVPD